MAASSAMTIQINDQTKTRLTSLAQTTSRSELSLVEEALENFLNINEWHSQAIQTTVDKIERGETRFASHEKVSAWLSSWGSDNELEPPECS